MSGGGFVGIAARCQDCNFRQYERNAMGLAAQHHYRTRHVVIVDVNHSYVFQNEPTDANECVHCLPDH